MAATRIGVVYARGSGMVRRWIVPDNDVDLIDKHPVSPGEAMLLVDRANIPVDLSDPSAAIVYVELAVQRVTGNLPPSARCVILDKSGAVVGAVMADPDIDAIPGYSLVLDDNAGLGWKMRAGVLVDVVAEAAAAVVPATDATVADVEAGA